MIKISSNGKSLAQLTNACRTTICNTTGTGIWNLLQNARCLQSPTLSNKFIIISSNHKRKYIAVYNEFITQLQIYAKTVRISVKGYTPISLIMPYKLQEILDSVKATQTKCNPDYDIVIKRLHLYYDMKLVTFGIDRDRNLIIQFPVFVQPYTQQPLILYQ